MPSFRYTAAVGVVALISRVSAHGIVSGIVANGAWQSGYDPSFKYSNPAPVVAGWSIPDDSDRGFVSDYTSPDIICHKSATPGGSYVSVAAGDSIELEWTVWPDSHHGPVIDYLAACGDDCTTVDKTQLLFNKIDEAGLNNGDPAPGSWASDDLIANNNSWTVTIPSSIAPGKYVLRHEIIALHSAYDVGGAQNYPQCINIEVSGTGTDSLSSGIKGTDLYTATDPGILVSIYFPVLTNYTIPGPALHDGSVSSPQPSATASSSTTTTSASSVVAPTSASSSTTSPFASTEITASPPTTSAVVSPTEDSSRGPTTSVESDATTTVETTSTTTTTIIMTPSAPEETDCPSESDSATSPSSTSSGPADIPAKPTAFLPKPSESEVAPTATSAAPSVPASSSTVPVSFTSTVTGRIGRPTRFVCYIDDDEFTLSPV